MGSVDLASCIFLMQIPFRVEYIYGNTWLLIMKKKRVEYIYDWNKHGRAG